MRYQLLILLLLPFMVVSQKPQITSEKTFAYKAGTVNVKENLHKTFPDNFEKIKLARRDNKIPKNFENRFPRQIVSPELEHQGPDKLRQSSIPPSKKPPLEVLVNQNGIGINGSPGDPSGDAGAGYYVQAVNITRIGVFDRAGDLIENFSSRIFWQSLNLNPGGDPIVLFDQEHQRWIITEFPAGFGSNANRLLVAVSETEDPLGDFNVYSFGTPNFPDYPKYGIWDDAITVTTNEQGSSSLETYVINKNDLINGEDVARIQRLAVAGTTGSEQGFILAMPLDWSGTTPPPAGRDPIILSLADASWRIGQQEDMVNIFSINIDWDDENNSDIVKESITVSPYDSYPCSASGGVFSCIPQKDGVGLDGLPEIVMFQPHYRNFGTHEAMVMCFVTDVTDGDNLSGLRWIEIRRTATEPWSLYQEGTYAPDDGLDRFMGNVAFDGQGNIALTFSASSEDEYVSLRMTGRQANDPLGVMTFEEQILVSGTSAVNSGGRYCDYTHMSIDAADDATFWFTSEYPSGNNRMSTRIVSFMLTRSEFDIAPITLTNPETSSDLTAMETIGVEIKNNGLSPITDFTVGFEVNGTAYPSTDYSISPLSTDETYLIDQLGVIDMSQLGDYDITIYTTMALDGFVRNDTLRKTISKLAKLDVEATAILGIMELECGGDQTLQLRITNLGSNEINSASIGVFVNGQKLNNNVDYSGSIISNASEEIDINLTGLIDGTNQLRFVIESINGDTDELPDNNEIVSEISIVENTKKLYIEFLTDPYPGENTWEILDANGDLVQAGTLEDENRTATVVIPLCVDPGKCFTFTIFDSYGDGMATMGDPVGSYAIYNEDRELIVSIINHDFGTEESNSFCLEGKCHLEASLSTLKPSDNLTADGMITVEVTNGAGPEFQYSIDGVNFTESNLFDDLPAGSYEVTIRDLTGCELVIMVDLPAETTSTSELSIIEVNRIYSYPNPTTGIVNISIPNSKFQETFLPMDVIDIEGKIIQRTELTRYNDSHKGMLSLVHYPAGIYYLRIGNKDEKIMSKIFKE